MANRYTLKVYPEGRGREVYRVLTISGDADLDSLCDTILNAFDFDHDHLYEYCMNNKMYRGDTILGPDVEEADGEGYTAADVLLDDLHLVKGQKFSLHYDFGDDWMFPITVQKIEEAEGHVPTAVVKSKGDVEQYPQF